LKSFDKGKMNVKIKIHTKRINLNLFLLFNFTMRVQFDVDQISDKTNFIRSHQLEGLNIV